MKKRLLSLSLLLLSAAFSLAQEIDIKKYELAYTLAPIVGEPLTVSKMLKTFQWRAFGKNTQFIPAESKPNYLGDKELYVLVKGWKQVRKDPEFYLDFYYSPAVISEEIVVEQKKAYAMTPPLTEKVYRIKYKMPVEVKLTRPDGTLLYEMSFPEEELFYDLTEAEAVKYGSTPNSGTGFQSETAAMDAAKTYRDKLLENVEYAGAKYFTIEASRFKNNLHPYFYFRMFPYEGEETVALALINNTQNTPFANLRLEEANKLAQDYYSAIESDYMNWREKKDLMISATGIWADAMATIDQSATHPLHKEMVDACAYNISVGLTYLNAFETSEQALNIFNREGDYGIGLGKTNRYERMLERARLQKNEVIPFRRNLARLRGWKKEVN